MSTHARPLSSTTAPLAQPVCWHSPSAVRQRTHLLLDTSKRLSSWSERRPRGSLPLNLQQGEGGAVLTALWPTAAYGSIRRGAAAQRSVRLLLCRRMPCRSAATGRRAGRAPVVLQPQHEHADPQHGGGQRPCKLVVLQSQGRKAVGLHAAAPTTGLHQAVGVHPPPVPCPLPFPPPSFPSTLPFPPSSPPPPKKPPTHVQLQHHQLRAASQADRAGQKVARQLQLRKVGGTIVTKGWQRACAHQKGAAGLHVSRGSAVLRARRGGSGAACQQGGSGTA
jgi:hypothetical protein